MSVRLDIRLPEENHEILMVYCAKTGSTKTGAIKMLIRRLGKKNQN